MRGSPSMCIRQQSAPLSATSAAISGSARRALTSLTRLAPAGERGARDGRLGGVDRDCVRAGLATGPRPSPLARRSPRHRAAPRRSSSSARRPARRPAAWTRRRRRGCPRPRRSAARACATAAPRVQDTGRRRRTSPGVTFTIPIRRERARAHRARLASDDELRRRSRSGGARGALGVRRGAPRCRRRGPGAGSCAALRARRGRRAWAARAARACRLLLDAEHLLLALAVEQGEELLLLDRLALDEDLGDLRRGRAGAR